jgi:feruloyl esterase
LVQLREGANATASLIKRIDPIVKATCDKLDGVEDGLIQNPMACNFRPERDLPRCDGKTARTQCFTDAEVETISAVVTAVTDEDGNVVQPGFSVSEIQPSFRMSTPPDRAASNPWPTVTRGTQEMWGLAYTDLAIFAHKNDPDFNMRSLFTFRAGGPGNITGFRVVVPKAEVAKDVAGARMGIGTIPENAEKLIRQNRKLLIWSNLSDQLLTPYMAINYYKQLAKIYGGYEKLQNNIRLFGIPGSSHCSMSGVGPNNFDPLTAMENWVEKGQPPDSLNANLYDPDGPGIDPKKTPLRSMPLCKFPAMARYSGKGDINDAANWSCPANDSSMLKVGESGRQAGVDDGHR